MDLPLVNVVEMRLVGAHELWLRFSDGAAGAVDLRAELDGVVFEPLRDPAYFARAVLNPDLRTVTWPNGADFAPEFLRSLLPSHVVA
jgi:hypothetical protein